MPYSLTVDSENHLVVARFAGLLDTVCFTEYNDEMEQKGPFAAPYNLLVTRRWMLLVPRTREFFETISINALGFAGSLFARNRQQLEAAVKYGPLRILRQVSGA